MSGGVPNLSLYLLLHGQYRGLPLHVADIPKAVATKLAWKTTKVFLTYKDAQKIRFHSQHGMDHVRGLHLPLVVKSGDYYQQKNRGTDLQIEVVLHEPDNPKRAYFLVLARDKQDKGVFVRTFYFTSELSRNKMSQARALLQQSTYNYFK